MSDLTVYIIIDSSKAGNKPSRMSSRLLFLIWESTASTQESQQYMKAIQTTYRQSVHYLSVLVTTSVICYQTL